MARVRRGGTVRTTVRLPRALHEKARRLAKSGGTSADTMNDLIESAVAAYIRLLERKKIDAAFEGMSGDASYREEAERIAGEFSESDWESFEAAEREGSRG